ncbi:MAG: pitrilysin family protein [bacterium]
MRHVRKLSLMIVVCLSLAQLMPAQTRNIRVNYKETTLKNGLRVITVEDHTAPVVSTAVTYNVGSRDEKKGKTGYAHLFEHMMFKGSENVGAGEHPVLVRNNGGGENASTSEDRTNYFEALPANQLELALFLESDRMRSLAVTKDNLDNERHNVQEERRQRVDNQPYGKSGELQQELIYDNFAYKHSVIGSMEDLNAASVDDIKDFFRIYYAPNNAVLVIVGDFKTTDALAKVRKYFESIPRQPNPPPVDQTEPAPKEERRATVSDQLARATQVAIAFKTVPGNTPDFYALQVLSVALQGGQSSRLYQKLVRERELVTSVGGFNAENRGPGAFYITATLRPGLKTDAVEAAIYEEIERLQKESIADWELQKAKSATRRSFLQNAQRSLSTAVTIGQYAVYYNEPGLINTRLDKVTAVTKADVQRVANTYLSKENRVVVITTRGARGAGNAGQ